MSRDVEIELNYDENTVTITNESGVYEYDMTKDVMDAVDFLIEGGTGYSVYSQEEEEFVPDYVTFEEGW